MAIMIPKNNQPVIAPEGMTRGQFIKAYLDENANSKNGNVEMLNLIFETKEGFQIRHMMSTTYLGKSRLVELVSAVLGDEPEELNVDDLLFKECEARVIHYTTPAGRKIPNLTDIRRLEESETSAAEAARIF